jgi:hypothetical protein
MEAGLEPQTTNVAAAAAAAAAVCAGVPTVSSGLNGRWPDACSNTPVGGKCNVACNSGEGGHRVQEC